MQLSRLSIEILPELFSTADYPSKREEAVVSVDFATLQWKNGR